MNWMRQESAMKASAVNRCVCAGFEPAGIRCPGKPEVKPANATRRSSATCYVQRRQPVMSNASKSFTSMQATRSHRRDVNGMVGQWSTFNQMRTFLREICVPLQPADPLKSTASAALQNGLMFQPHSESTSFTSWGASASGACVNRPSEARPLVRVQLSPPQTLQDNACKVFLMPKIRSV